MARIAEEIELRRPWRRSSFANIIAILIVSAALRLYGLGWGLPDVFEEATPLDQAWKMWGWGSSDILDLNPHFFNYPSLVIYCQFIGQGALYLGMRLGGFVNSGTEYAALYVTDKTPFLIIGRMITVLFGIATIWILYKVCLKIASPTAAYAAAFILAVCAFHIEKSQVVEVDVPLAFFCLLALWFMLGIAGKPSRRNYLWAGTAIGLAVSTKYTAVFLLLPLVASHLLVSRADHDRSSSIKVRKERRGRWRFLAAAAGITIVVFFVTSPFVFIDASTSLKHLAIERLHMREGHFGLETSGTVWFYLRTLSEQILGLPIIILAAGGLLYRAVLRRSAGAVILASFLLPYSITIGSWAMKADRYLMPILPVIVIFAAVCIEDIICIPRIAAAGRPWRVGAAAALFLAATTPIAFAYPQHMKQYAPDTRTLAREWIEANIPSGSFIATEAYGPNLLGPHALFSLDGGTRDAALARTKDRPQYAVQPVPMLQVYPERSAAFYDLRLYQDVDIFITSSAVASRYRREPRRFRDQLAYYDSLEARCRKLMVFSSVRGPGPTLKLYEMQRGRAPFAARRDIHGPSPLKSSRRLKAGALFYKNLGVNYEVFGFNAEAAACYKLARGFEAPRP